MLVVSYLPQLLLPRLADAVRDIGADHVHTSIWDEVEDILRRKPVGVLVLDPYAEQTSRSDEVASLLRQFPSTPVIAYTQFVPPALRTLTLLAQHGLRETVLFQVDDSCSRLSRLLAQAATHSLVTRMLNELRDELGRLPTMLSDAVNDLFKRPHAYASGQDLVLTSHVPLTSIYRAFAEAGLGSPKQLFIAARVLHAVGYLCDPGYTVEQVAVKTGYLHPRVMTQHTLAVCNARPSELRNIQEEELLASLVRWATSQEKSSSTTLEPSTTTEPNHPFKVDFEAGDSDRDMVEDRRSVINSEILHPPNSVWGSLLGYGQHLESTRNVRGALCIYLAMAHVLKSSDNKEDIIWATIVVTRCGYVARFFGHFDASDEAYCQAHLLAEKAGSKLLALRVKIGLMNTMKARGNLGDAEVLIEQVLAESVEKNMVDVEAWALHSRASVRTARGRHAEALADLFHAYELTENATEQELLLGDMAGCAWEAGYRQVACDAYRVLAHTAREPIVRSAALGNLLEYSTYDGTVADFERLKEQVVEFAQKHPLPVDHTIQFALHTAYGIERFGERDAAIAAYRSVIEKAQHIGAHQIVFKAEERLTALLSGTPHQESPPSQEPPETLRVVVDTIAAWSARATASV